MFCNVPINMRRCFDWDVTLERKEKSLSIGYIEASLFWVCFSHIGCFYLLTRKSCSGSLSFQNIHKRPFWHIPEALFWHVPKLKFYTSVVKTLMTLNNPLWKFMMDLNIFHSSSIREHSKLFSWNPIFSFIWSIKLMLLFQFHMDVPPRIGMTYGCSPRIPRWWCIHSSDGNISGTNIRRTHKFMLEVAIIVKSPIWWPDMTEWQPNTDWKFTSREWTKLHVCIPLCSMCWLWKASKSFKL